MIVPLRLGHLLGKSIRMTTQAFKQLKAEAAKMIRSRR
jgi:hypothetical protein